MKKRILLSAFVGCLSWGLLPAQEFHLQPTPQECTVAQDSVTIPRSYAVSADSDGGAAHALQLLEKVWPGRTDKASFRLVVGVKGDKVVRKYAGQIPERAEGYYLKIAKDEVVIAAADSRGVCYGVQTLGQLLTLPKLPLMEITDYPDVPYRGIVEGFYGTPWSHEARLSQLEFCGRNKMNVYIYGPKDDPYHRTPHWRDAYPPREAAQLQQLVERARTNNVIFYWAIHPGQDIKWNEEDRRHLMDKFEQMYRLGVRAFAVFFDDISGEGTDAGKQADLLNYLDDHFVKAKGDVDPLIMCPTEYNRRWARPEGGYLTTLGNKLNEDIQIMWTGDNVMSNINRATMEFVNPLLKRKAYIWWNYPVSDYIRARLLLGPVCENGLDIGNEMAGFVSNPMEHAEASKIALYGVADYTWNMADYDSESAWLRAMRDLMPHHAAYLATFAAHNSNLGNQRNFRLGESVALKPALEKLCTGYTQQHQIDEAAFRQVREECGKMVTAADVLSASTENPQLIKEIELWLIQFKLLGQYGESVLDMLSSAERDKAAFQDAYVHATALQKLMQRVDTTYNQNPSQPGVQTGTKVLLPVLHSLFEASVKCYNAHYGACLEARPIYQPKIKK